VLRKLLVLALGGVCLPANVGFAAESAIGQAVQALHLSAQQLLSLRDFLGPFSRGSQIESAGGGLFIIRDTGSMAYAGEFSLRVDDHGALQIDRVSGPAVLDLSYRVRLPVKLDSKSRTQVSAVLANSQATQPAIPAPAETIEHIVPALALPELSISAIKQTNGNAIADLSQARAVFFRDGSGSAVSIRVQLGSTAPTLRFSARYFSPVRADGTQVWRDSVAEVDSTLSTGLADLESHDVCPAAGACAVKVNPAAQTGQHLIRWSKQLIAGVPATLMAELSPPAAAAAQASAQANPADSIGDPGGQPMPAQTGPSGGSSAENLSGH